MRGNITYQSSTFAALYSSYVIYLHSRGLIFLQHRCYQEREREGHEELTDLYFTYNFKDYSAFPTLAPDIHEAHTNTSSSIVKGWRCGEDIFLKDSEGDERDIKFPERRRTCLLGLWPGSSCRTYRGLPQRRHPPSHNKRNYSQKLSLGKIKTTIIRISRIIIMSLIMIRMILIMKKDDKE